MNDYVRTLAYLLTYFTPPTRPLSGNQICPTQRNNKCVTGRGGLIPGNQSTVVYTWNKVKNSKQRSVFHLLRAGLELGQVHISCCNYLTALCRPTEISETTWLEHGH